MRENSFCIKQGYNSREHSQYFEDFDQNHRVIYQPDVYRLARELGRAYGCSHIIDIGCGKAGKLIDFYPDFETIGIDYLENIDYCHSSYPFGMWIEFDLELDKRWPLDMETVKKSVLICSDVIEHLFNPSGLLKNLSFFLDHAPIALLSTPERDIVRGINHNGPPDNPAHIREWNLREFETLLDQFHFRTSFMGLTVNNNIDLEKSTILAILEKNSLPEITQIPEDFRVVALVASYNEEDIIESCFSHLIQQGIEIYLIDNWSKDRTFELAQSFLGQGLIGLERFPSEGPGQYYNWKDILHRKEELSAQLEADWYIHHDVDEIRTSPWPNTTLREGIYRVDQLGWNCVDHTELTFYPIDNQFLSGQDFETYFRFFKFGNRIGFFPQQKSWKNLDIPVNLAESGGHTVTFQNKRIYPFNFLLKHYPIRSQTHGEKKVFTDRTERFDPAEKAKGWHVHYDDIDSETSFLKKPSELILFDERSFYCHYLIEGLTSAGETLLHMREDGNPQNLKLLEEIDNLSTEKQRLEEKLHQIQSQLDSIYESNFWKAARLYYHIRDRLFPQGSPQRFFLTFFLKSIKALLKSLKGQKQT